MLCICELLQQRGGNRGAPQCPWGRGWGAFAAPQRHWKSLFPVFLVVLEPGLPFASCLKTSLQPLLEILVLIP